MSDTVKLSVLGTIVVIAGVTLYVSRPLQPSREGQPTAPSASAPDPVTSVRLRLLEESVADHDGKIKQYGEWLVELRDKADAGARKRR